jgi:hypothetical protein
MWQGRATGAPAAPKQPVPVTPETGAVPAHDRVRADDGEAFDLTVPESAQQNPEKPVSRPNDGATSTLGPGRPRRYELVWTDPNQGVLEASARHFPAPGRPRRLCRPATWYALRRKVLGAGT